MSLLLRIVQHSWEGSDFAVIDKGVINCICNSFFGFSMSKEIIIVINDNNFFSIPLTLNILVGYILEPDPHKKRISSQTHPIQKQKGVPRNNRRRQIRQPHPSNTPRIFLHYAECNANMQKCNAEGAITMVNVFALMS